MENKKHTLLISWLGTNGLIILLSFVMLFVSAKGWAQVSYQDKMVVVHENGIPVYDSPNHENMQEIGWLAFGSEVLVTDALASDFEVFGGFEGTWMRVEFAGTEGFVFSAFLEFPENVPFNELSPVYDPPLENPIDILP